MERTSFTATTGSGGIVGWVVGDGPPVLALHGGPALNFDYLDGVVEEVGARHRVATLSATRVGALDRRRRVHHRGGGRRHRGGPRRARLGHRLPDGSLLGRTPRSPRGHVRSRSGCPECWPSTPWVRWGTVDPRSSWPSWSYACPRRTAPGSTSSRPRSRPRVSRRRRTSSSSDWCGRRTSPSRRRHRPMPPVEMSQSAYEGLWADVNARLPELEAALPSIRVPVGVLVGERSPIPTRAGIDTADRIPGAWWRAEPGAGHFIWLEVPGAVVAAMDRLTARVRPADR